MKKASLSLFVIAAISVSANTAVVGTETGANWTTANWLNGASNSAGQWFIPLDPGSSSAIGNSATDGRPSIGSQAFNLIPGAFTNTGGGYANAYWVFSGGALTNGQSVSFDLNFYWNNGTKGFQIQTANGDANLFQVQQDWSDPVVASLGGLAAPTNVFSNGFSKALTLQALQGNGSITFNVREFGSSSNIVSSVLTTNATIAQIRFYAGNIDTNQVANSQNQSIYFNNIATVPEPSTYALLALSAIGLAGYVARRRARR